MKIKYFSIFIIMLLFLTLLAPPIIVSAMPTHGGFEEITDGDHKGHLGFKSTPNKNISGSRNNDRKEVNHYFKQYSEAITLFGGLATITLVGVFIWHFVKLAGLGTEHWILKRSCMIGMLWSGLAAALLGSGTLTFALFYGAFQ